MNLRSPKSLSSFLMSTTVLFEFSFFSRRGHTPRAPAQYWFELVWTHSEKFSGHHLRLYAPSDQAFTFSRETERRVRPTVGSVSPFSSSHLLIFTSSHLPIFISSHPHIFTSSHLHIFTTSHLHILTSSLFLLLPPCPLAPLALSFFPISLLKARAGAVPTRLHETQPFRTKRGSIVKNWGKSAISRCPPQPFRTKRGSIVKNWIAISGFPLQPFRTK